MRAWRTDATLRASGRLGTTALAAVVLWIAPCAAAMQNTGERSPQVSSGQFSNSPNGLACDGLVAQATAGFQAQTFSLFGFDIPAGATVTGILVRVRANDGNDRGRNLQVSVSWNGGRSFSGYIPTQNFQPGAPLRDFYVGGSRALWGHAWTHADLGDRNFRLRLRAEMPGGSEPINLDCPPVTVFYAFPTPRPRAAEKTPDDEVR